MNAEVQVVAVLLTEIERELSSIYRAERTNKSAWRIRHVLAGLRRVGARWSTDLTVSLVNDWKQSLAPLAPKTIATYLTTADSICTYLANSGRLFKNPFRLFNFQRFPKPARVKKRHHSLDDLRRVFATLERERHRDWKSHRLFALFSVAILLGMRKTEILRLKVADVDLRAETLAIVRRGRLKTEASEAVLPLPRELAEVLREWIPGTGSEWLFPGVSRKSWWNEGAPGKKPLDVLREAGRACGVAGLTFASLRHSWGTHAKLAWGLTPGQIQAILRHTTERTQTHYQHADADDFRRLAARVRVFDPGEPRGEVA